MNDTLISVAWSRFGGDGPSDAPLETYYVWRRVDAASKDGTLYETLADVPASVTALDSATIEAAGLRHLEGVYLIEIDRKGEAIPAVAPTERLQATLRGGEVQA